VRDGRVHAVDPDLYNRPGAGVGAAALGLAERSTPDSTVAPAARRRAGTGRRLLPALPARLLTLRRVLRCSPLAAVLSP
jgi:hypothetical protein